MSQRPRHNTQALEAAVRALHAQQPKEAEALATRVLAADRSNVHAAHILGAALLMQDRPDEAVALLQPMAKRSRQPAIETLLAKALAATGRTDEALDELRNATMRRPSYPAAFLELGVGLGDLGRTEDGVAVLEEGLTLAPDADGLRIALGYLHLKRNDRAAARGAFQQVHAAAPTRPDAMIGLAKVMALDGDYALAADLYRRVLSQRPNEAGLQVELAKCLLEMGRRQEGESALKAVAGGGGPLAGMAITALAATSHGRAFLSPSAALRYMRA